MRRMMTVWSVVLALVAVSCGTTGGGGGHEHKVSAGARPRFAAEGEPVSGAAGSKSPALSGWLASQVHVSTTIPPVAVTAGANGSGPTLPGAGPRPPGAAGPAVPGDRPSAQSNLLAAMTGSLSGAVADVPTRVYVPNSDAHTISVIDPNTLQVVATYATSNVPHHITPSWDLTKLYVNNTNGNQLSVIDPRSGKVTDTISVVDPYNLYFTPDGTKAIVVAERMQRLDFRDPKTWAVIKSVPIPGSGVDHMDFSADGKFLIASDEFSGDIVKVDTEKMEVAGFSKVGGLPIDVKMSPDGSVFFVTNQGRHGVSVIDPNDLKELAFLPTARGAHGLNYSRDTKSLYVSNRLDGSISVIDVASRQVTATWKVGGSPDMLQVSTDGTKLWVSNRYHGSVSVIDTSDGHVVKTIPTGAGAHGLCLFPQPGRYSVGHNGVYR